LSIAFAVAAAAFMSIGFVWASKPMLFLRIYRQIAVGDYHAKSTDWERQVLGVEGRLFGCLVFCGGLYLLLKILRIV
jgi:hypothetical protein